MIHLPKIKARLTATVYRIRACLDFPSLLAIDYARAALRKHGAESAPSSLVIRIALAHYAEHLSNPTTSMEVEAYRAHLLSRVSPMSEQERNEALKMLNEAIEGAPLPPFHDLMFGPGTSDATARAVRQSLACPFQQGGG